MSYRDPKLSEKWLKEAQWRADNDKFVRSDHRKIINRLIDEVRRLNSELGYLEMAGDPEYKSEMKARRDSRNSAVVVQKIRVLLEKLYSSGGYTDLDELHCLDAIRELVSEEPEL